VRGARVWAIGLEIVCGVRLAALRSQCLSVAKNFSMGFGSGEYLGRNSSLALVAAKIVHDHDIALMQRRNQDFLDIALEAFAVDRPVEQPWRIEAAVPQRRQKGHGLPMAMRHVSFDALALGRPTAQRGHVGPGLVDEDEVGDVDPAAVLAPLSAPARHIRTLLLGGDQGLFLCVSFSAWTTSHTER